MHAEEYKRMRMMIVGGKGQPGMMKGMKGNMANRNMNPHNMQMNASQMARMLPPQVLKQMGGASALAGLMKQMEGTK